jgi:hypothetical protein
MVDKLEVRTLATMWQIEPMNTPRHLLGVAMITMVVENLLESQRETPLGPLIVGVPV